MRHEVVSRSTKTKEAFTFFITSPANRDSHFVRIRNETNIFWQSQFFSQVVGGEVIFSERPKWKLYTKFNLLKHDGLFIVEAGHRLERSHTFDVLCFTQSKLIEPALPQAAQLGSHFYCFHNTLLGMLIHEECLYGHSAGVGEKEKIERRGRKKAQLPAGIEPTTSWFRGNCSTTGLWLLPNF